MTNRDGEARSRERLARTLVYVVTTSSRTDMTSTGEGIDTLMVFVTHTYAWGNNEKRVALKGRHCRVVARGRMRSVLVEFGNGERVVTSERALRRAA